MYSTSLAEGRGRLAMSVKAALHLFVMACIDRTLEMAGYNCPEPDDLVSLDRRLSVVIGMRSPYQDDECIVTSEPRDSRLKFGVELMPDWGRASTEREKRCQT